MNKIIPHLTAGEHFGSTCAFWNSHDDWFLQRDQIKAHLYNGSLRLVDITDAMKPGKMCEEFTFNWNWHAGTPPGLAGLFKRHGYHLRSLFNELRGLDWQHRKHWKTDEVAPDLGWQELSYADLVALFPAEEFGRREMPGDSLTLHRSERSSIRVWSPFATVKPLPEPPKKWTVAHVVRALLCGQFSNLKCEGVYTDDYAYDAAVNFHIGEFGSRPGAAVAFARRILESPSGWWASVRGEAAGHVSICCHHFDSNSFKFELMKRFNPAAQLAATPLPDGDIAIPTAPCGEPPTRTVEVLADGQHKRNANAVAQITLTINTGRNLVELRFPDKPDEDVRAEMKAAKFRWYGPAGCWYHKHTPENLAWAEQFVARQQTVPASTVAATQLPAPVKPIIPRLTPQVAPLAGMTPLGIPSWRQRFHRS